ncbi:hypothetical protein [Rheinheimera sp. UJ63]|uniref:hypothetical protein n=1 Tax=Rheinheimera sp. UJ63 TaxID=2910157 RepID=UPI001F202969|nr:hypothetical protein [Rheinheimera sp. UJ63]MCF4008416.1 hypothetical protein [Rheinheimera sp. UJ63]
MNTAHGNYSLSVNGHVIFCDYSQGFNIEGVRKLTHDLLVLVSSMDEWVLFQNPDESAGIVHNAIVEMMSSYVKLQNAGCKAVAIVENSIFVNAGIRYHPKELTMPIRIDKDGKMLLAWLETELKKPRE